LIIHFPADALKAYDIEALHPDTFIVPLIQLDRTKAIEALHCQVNSLKNPPKTLEEVLEALQKCGLNDSVVLCKGAGPAGHAIDVQVSIAVKQLLQLKNSIIFVS
jgi:hypothetical protein